MDPGGAIYFSSHSPPLLSPPTTANTNSPTLSLLCHATHPNHVPQIHARLVKTNTAHNNFYLSKLLSLYLHFHRTDDARHLFDHAKKPNALTWNTLIKGYVEHGLFHEALLLFRRMLRTGIRPDSYTFPFILKTCDVLSIGMMSHSLVVKLGFETNIHVLNSLVNMYCECSRVDLAREMFDEIPERDVVSYTAMISGHAKDGDMENAVSLFESMPEKDVVSWGAILTGLVRNDCHDETLLFFREMQLCGVRPGEVAIVSGLSSCASLGLRSPGLWLHAYMVRNGFKLTAFASTALIDMYAKCGDLDNALRVFLEMADKSVASWNSMIGGLAMNGRTEEALVVFEKMVGAGIEPNAITLSTILSACRHGGLVEEGHYYFKQFHKQCGFSPNIDHYGCMVDLFGRAGRVNKAYELIKTMPMEPNEVIWGALLGACRIHGYLELAEEVLDHLVELDPENGGNYVLLSNMYAVLGRWEDVERVRAEMRNREAEKTPGSSAVEVDGVVHEFYAGDRSHPWAPEVYARLEELYMEMALQGYRPNSGV